MNWQSLLLVLIGLGVGMAAAFTGLGGGIVMVPLLLALGYEAQKAVGTSFLAILIISVSALAAHGKLANVDWKMGLLLGVGGIVGAQIGARLVEHVSTAGFRKVFAVLLVGVGVYFFAKS
ncbi:MAG: sulfite exporter TauE/SafE family protein [Acidobacteriota bacterium]